MGILVISDDEKELRRCPHCDSPQLYRREYFDGPTVSEENDTITLYCHACGRHSQHNVYGGSLVVEGETDEMDIESDDQETRVDEGRTEHRCTVCGAGNWVPDGSATFHCRRCGTAGEV